MNTLSSLAEGLRTNRKIVSDVELASRTGLTRQSVSRALSGKQNFTVITLLALADANGLEVMLVPKQVARALFEVNTSHADRIPTIIDQIRHL